MSSRALKLAAAIATAAALASAGCGGGSDTTRNAGGPDTAGARTDFEGGSALPVRAVIRQLRAAASAKSCAKVKTLLHPVYGKVSEESCAATKDLLAGIRGARGRAYGPGAVVDFRAKGGTRRAAVLVRSGGTFKLLFVEDVPEPTTRSLFLDDFDATAKSVLTVLATGDCSALASIAHASIGPALDRTRSCADLPKSPLVLALGKHPKAKPQRLGGNSYYAFYRVRPDKETDYVMVLAQQDPAAGTTNGGAPAARYAFVDAVPR